MSSRTFPSEGLPPVRSKTEPIPDRLLFPHHDDPYFWQRIGARTIFLAMDIVVPADHIDLPIDGIDYKYSSADFRYVEPKKMKRAKGSASWHANKWWVTKDNLGHYNKTATYYELLLQRAFDEPDLELHHIMAGVFSADGCPYHIYGTTTTNTQANR